MSAPEGINWEWATRTGGTLNARDKMKLVAPLVRAVGSFGGERVRMALGRRGHGRLDLDSVRWPDSQLARDAESEAREVLTPHVLQHSYRTYLFGLVLAGLDGVAIDEEIAFVSSLLHDLHLEHPTLGRCFAVVGGERAEHFSLSHGVEPKRAAVIGAAVAGHLTPGATEDLSDPAGFVAAGALTDVTGARLQQTDPQWVADLINRYPRLEFKRHMRACLAIESEQVPNGRIRLLRRYAAFPLLIRTAPFPE
ncbi:MAG: phosphohydrolase [Acidimicrobiales bacterium]|jgi:hypothetical protein